MKKILFILSVMVSALTYAQTEKGSFFVGSDFGLSYTSESTVIRRDGNKISDVTTSTFKIAPNANYFIIDNLSVGLGLEYQYSKVKGASSSSNDFMIAPNAHYFFPLGGEILPFVGVKVGYGTSSQGDKDANKYRGLIAGGKAGVAYFLNEGFALTGFLGYDYKSYTNVQDRKIEANRGTFGVGIGVALFY